MSRVLLDTNIILDVALEGREYFVKSKELMLLIQKNNISAYVSATTTTGKCG